MKTNPIRFWTIVILLGWAFDFLFWSKPGGINFAIYVALCIVTGIFLLRLDGLRLSPRSGLLLIPIAFLASMTFLRLEPMTVFLSVAMTVFFMGVFAITGLGGRWLHYALLDYVFGYFQLFASMIARPLGFVAETRRLPTAQPDGEESNGSVRQGTNFLPILRGIVIALPVIAVFASLLSSADPIFASRFEDLIALFRIENLPEYIFRLVYILIFAYALAGTYLHAAQSLDERISEDKPIVPPFLGFTEAGIVLGSLAALFIVFVVIQFQYFFGGQANISIEGYTFSEYARKGFGELVTVAFFSLLLILGLGSITRREFEPQRRIFSSLSVGIVGLVIVMLVSAFQRLVLYEHAYGFSRLRTYTHVFMIWLGILLVAVVLLELLRRERRIGFTMVMASLGFIVSLNVLNVDAFIVKQNVQREIQGTADNTFARGREDLDVNYFLGLSDDAVPSLVNALRSKSLPGPIKEKIGAALTCIRYSRLAENHLPWQSFHFSRFMAGNALDEVKQELDTYELIETDMKVKTPRGEEFSCWQYYYD